MVVHIIRIDETPFRLRYSPQNDYCIREKCLEYFIQSMKFNRYLTKSLVLVLFIFANFFLSQKPQDIFAAGNTYYVSTSGSDTNMGSVTSPFKTFAKATSMLSTGDKLFVMGGTYQESLIVTNNGTASSLIEILPYNGQTVIIDGGNSRSSIVKASGSYIKISGFEVKNSAGYCVDIRGNYITVDNLNVHNCYSMGIYTEGKYSSILNNKVSYSSMNNSGRNASSWGSGIKVKVGGENISIINNEVFNNYGEGIAITRGGNVTVRENKVWDNFSVNVYVDNSYDVLVEKNFSYCTPNSGFEKVSSNNRRAYAYAIGEEFYDGWGAKLARVTIVNNIAAFCYKGVANFNADVTGGGMDTVTIANNTLWGNVSTALSLAYDSGKQRNVTVSNNIIHQSGGQLLYVQNNTGISLNNNLWSPTKPSGSGSSDKSAQEASIFLVTPSYLVESYKIGSNSPAYNFGITLSQVINDYFGNQRPQFGSFDIGAHEYTTDVGGGSSPVPTPVIKSGDENGENLVNDFDYSIWLSNYNKALSGATNGDFNNSGKVDGVDYVIWLNNL